MRRKEGTLLEGMKQVLAEDHMIQHATEMADKQMDREILRTPKPEKKEDQKPSPGLEATWPSMKSR